MPAMRGDNTPDSQTYVTASEAASMLGLEERLIEWALDRHILAGQRDQQGRWTVSHSEIEAGQRPLEEQFDYLRTRDDRMNGATKDAAGLPEVPRADQVIDAPAAPPATPDPAEIARLGKRIDQLLATVAAKDELISELARSVSRMGEMALERLPRPKD
jgi:hypothetical protein